MQDDQVIRLPQPVREKWEGLPAAPTGFMFTDETVWSHPVSPCCGTPSIAEKWGKDGQDRKTFSRSEEMGVDGKVAVYDKQVVVAAKYPGMRIEDAIKNLEPVEIKAVSGKYSSMMRRGDCSKCGRSWVKQAALMVSTV